MMFTQRENLNVLHNDQFIVIFVENGAIDQVSNILLVALGKI